VGALVLLYLLLNKKAPATSAQQTQQAPYTPYPNTPPPPPRSTNLNDVLVAGLNNADDIIGAFGGNNQHLDLV